MPGEQDSRSGRIPEVGRFNLGYLFAPAAEKSMFLSVTPGFEHGPGIERDGITAPRMLDPHTVPYVCASAGIPTSEPQQYTQDAFAQRAGAWTPFEHVKAFLGKRGGEWRVVGVQGCGDLTMNLWHVAYMRTSHIPGQERTFCGLLTDGAPEEPYASRVYRCLVKWNEAAAAARGGQPYEVIDLRFQAIKHGYAVVVEEPEKSVEIGRSFAEIDPEFAHSENIEAHIEFALSGKVIVERSEDLSLLSEIDKFDDVRHVLELVEVPACGYYRGQKVEKINFGEYELFDSLNVRRAALNGPVILNLDIENSVNVAWEDLQATLKARHFKETVTTPTRPGQFRRYPGLMGNEKVEIYLRPSVYPFGVIGLQAGGGIVALASGGLSGRIGNSLSAVSQMMFDHFRCDDAIVLDEGLDTFQLINPSKDGGYKYTNEETLDRVYWMTKDLIELDNQRSARPLSSFKLNERLLRDFEGKPASKERVDYADIVNVRPKRSQIRSVIIFAAKEPAES